MSAVETPDPLTIDYVDSHARLRGDEVELVLCGLEVADHALLVSRLVRVALHVGVPEHGLPPLGELVGVAAVDGRVGDERRHGVTVPVTTPRLNRVLREGHPSR